MFAIGRAAAPDYFDCQSTNQIMNSLNCLTTTKKTHTARLQPERKSRCPCVCQTDFIFLLFCGTSNQQMELNSVFGVCQTSLASQCATTKQMQVTPFLTLDFRTSVHRCSVSHPHRPEVCLSETQSELQQLKLYCE